MEWWPFFCWIVTTQYELSRSRGHWFISFWTIESLLASFPSRSSIRVGCLTDFRLTHSSTYFESIHFFQPYIHTATYSTKMEANTKQLHGGVRVQHQKYTQMQQDHQHPRLFNILSIAQFIDSIPCFFLMNCSHSIFINENISWLFWNPRYCLGAF